MTFIPSPDPWLKPTAVYGLVTSAAVYMLLARNGCERASVSLAGVSGER
jgi:hypothetical protein